MTLASIIAAWAVLWVLVAAVVMAAGLQRGWPLRRGRDRFYRPSGAVYFGHSAAGLRPAQIGTLTCRKTGARPVDWCRDRPHCRRRMRCPQYRLPCRQTRLKILV